MSRLEFDALSLACLSGPRERIERARFVRRAVRPRFQLQPKHDDQERWCMSEEARQAALERPLVPRWETGGK